MPKFGLKNTLYVPNVVIERNVKNSFRTVSNGRIFEMPNEDIFTPFIMHVITRQFIS
jgi:hypothetical protein